MKRILIIEDNEQTQNELKTEFENSGFETICCSDFDSAQKAVENDIPFDAIILDWFFVLPESNGFSLQILQKLKQKCFVPVFVYTGNLSDFKNKSEDELGYPKNIIIGTDKTITPGELQNQINSLLSENITLKIAKEYRGKIHQHLEKIFFELNESENSTLGKVLKVIYGDGNNVDWNNDVILTMLHRSLITDDSFTNSVSELLKNVADNNTNIEFNRKLVNKIVYHNGRSDYIRNGDIIRIKGNNNDVLGYGIIVTPDCDLENNKTQLIEIIEIIDIGDSKLGLNNEHKKDIKAYKHNSFFFFPAININGTLKDFVAILKSKFIIQEKDIAANTKYPASSKRHLYSQSFIFNGQEVKLEFLCSKVNPFKAEFLQKLNTHNSRVGIPDIKNLL
jgi:CheY-like chemotaxis protein